MKAQRKILCLLPLLLGVNVCVCTAAPTPDGVPLCDLVASPDGCLTRCASGWSAGLRAFALMRWTRCFKTRPWATKNIVENPKAKSKRISAASPTSTPLQIWPRLLQPLRLHSPDRAERPSTTRRLCGASLSTSTAHHLSSLRTTHFPTDLPPAFPHPSLPIHQHPPHNTSRRTHLPHHPPPYKLSSL